MALKCNLKCDNHGTNMMKSFKQLFLNQELCDVTIACAGTSLKAHKLILSAGSSYFQTLFLENPCKHPIVILKDMQYSEVRAILDFMYDGQTSCYDNQFHNLQKIAETLRVKWFDEASVEKCQLGDCQPQSHSVQPSPKQRRKRHRPSRMSESKNSDSDIELVHIIHKESPSSPIESISGESNKLKDHATEIANKKSQGASGQVIDTGMKSVEMPTGNLHSALQNDNESDSDIEFIQATGVDIEIIPQPTPLQKSPKQDADSNIVPEEEIAVEHNKLIEKASTRYDTSETSAECQISSENQPGQSAGKEVINEEINLDPVKLQEKDILLEKHLTANFVSKPSMECQISLEKQGTDKEIINEEPNKLLEESLTSNGPSPSLECQSGTQLTEVADLQPGCPSDTVPIPHDQSSALNNEAGNIPKGFTDDQTESNEKSSAIADQPEYSSDAVPMTHDQSSTAITMDENSCSKGLADITNETYVKSAAIANQPEYSSGEIYDSQTPLSTSTNSGESIPPAKRRKTSDEGDDEACVQKENEITFEEKIHE